MWAYRDAQKAGEKDEKMILASDYDGTFHVDEEQTLKNLEAVKRWRALGHEFGLVTGRSYEMAMMAVKEYQLPLDFLICNNGAAIYRLDGTLLDHTPMNRDRLKDFWALPSVKLAPRVFALSAQGTFIARMDQEITFFARQLDVPFISMDKVGELNPIWQFSLGFSKDEDAKICCQEINRLLGEDFSAYFNQWNVDVVAGGMSKSVGIHKYIKIAGKQGQRPLVVGDGGNDVDMIQEFGGFTIKGGCAQAKEVARRIFDSVEDLIENALQEESQVV